MSVPRDDDRRASPDVGGGAHWVAPPDPGATLRPSAGHLHGFCLHRNSSLPRALPHLSSFSSTARIAPLLAFMLRRASRRRRRLPCSARIRGRSRTPPAECRRRYSSLAKCGEAPGVWGRRVVPSDERIGGALLPARAAMLGAKQVSSAPKVYLALITSGRGSASTKSFALTGACAGLHGRWLSSLARVSWEQWRSCELQPFRTAPCCWIAQRPWTGLTS